MHDDIEYNSLWQTLRSREPHLAVRVVTSVFAGVTLAGFGMLATWAWAQSTGSGYVRDEVMAAALAAASLVWVGSLYWIWGRIRRAGTLVQPVLLTVGIGIATSLAGVAIDEIVRHDEAIVITAVGLVSCGIVMLVWLPAVLRLQRGRPVIGPDNQVEVRCPSCGYSLIGLYELRCPECGTRFTIDELIRAQDYTDRRSRKGPLWLSRYNRATDEPKQHAEA